MWDFVITRRRGYEMGAMTCVRSGVALPPSLTSCNCLQLFMIVHLYNIALSQAELLKGFTIIYAYIFKYLSTSLKVIFIKLTLFHYP